jgi:26S proteasome regulatory subunit T4
LQIEIPLPNESSREDILRIHSAKIRKQGTMLLHSLALTHSLFPFSPRFCFYSGEIDLEPIVKLSDGFNGADLRNVCTEAGMFAIRDERDYVIQVKPG